ncbi:ABC transporter substrate-binding protein [Cellulomonas marina]|uniref:Multiple sugar transport system substrate-binding protein n=1 Tax=Cellulomonas marina TaxID=988821 RepID=A0A1I1AA69_9CELL|nr:sugar ABC transporter substrate-binding protein [Cellulomonas marina]GIG30396.1 sugar ABC transporter substrate-binding protein [Cellulomonas marina]SFB34827.1 multiple sugar transport system substrate-binding protein [Cellulomonas marina]
MSAVTSRTSSTSRTRGRRTRARAGAAVAALSVLALTAACGSGGGGEGSSDGGGTTELTMAVWGGDTDKAAYQARIDMLEEEHPDIQVTLQLIPSDQYAQKVQTMIAGGDGPDIMQVAENVNVYSSKSQILPLDGYVAEAGLDLEERFGPVGTLYSYEDSVYAIPDRSGAMITYYNKDLFDAAGVAYPTADWTWEDARDAMQKLTVPGQQWGYGGAGWWAQWWSLAYQNGGAIIDESGAPTADSPEVVEALQWANDLTFKDHVSPTPAEYADMGPDMGGDPAFVAGKVAMNTTGFWAIGGLEDAGFNWDIAPFWGGKEKAVTAFGSGLAISRDSDAPDKAFEAIDFLTDAKAQEVIIDMAQDVPANLEVQNSDAFLNPEWATTPINMAAFGESADHIYRAPFIPEWNEMQQAFTDNLETFWNTGGDAKSALTAVQSQLESVVRTDG